MDDSEIRMKEYETLRQEILDHQKRREQLFLFSIASLGVVLGFALGESGIPFFIISFIPYFIIYNFCNSNAINSKHIITIGTYILYFIEKKHPEALSWETAWDKIAKNEKEKEEEEKSKNKGGGYWYVFCYVASVTTCLGMIFLAWIENKLEPSKFQQIPEILSLIVFTLLHIFTCILCIKKGVMEIHFVKLNRRTREKKKESWEKIYNEIKRKG